jgi:phytanoyl-CoA hydroxylase
MMVEVSSAKIREFEDQGYMVARGALDPKGALAPIFNDYSDILDALAEDMCRDGQMKNYDSTRPFLDRVHDIYRHGENILVQNFNISFPMRQGLPADTPICLPPSIFELMMNEALLDIIEDVLGPEIMTNPIQHVRVKPPEIDIPSVDKIGALHQNLGINQVNGLVNQTPWHQDKAVITPDADVTEMVTVWILLTECTEEHGCLLARPGGHRDGLRPHKTWSTLDLTLDMARECIDDHVTLPMQPGDVLLIHPHTHHASLSNRSNHVRWSLDLRYHRSGHPSGRAPLPSFVARSRANPALECRDHAAWVRSWHAARENLSTLDAVPPSHRWHSKQPDTSKRSTVR